MRIVGSLDVPGDGLHPMDLMAVNVFGATINECIIRS